MPPMTPGGLRQALARLRTVTSRFGGSFDLPALGPCCPPNIALIRHFMGPSWCLFYGAARDVPRRSP